MALPHIYQLAKDFRQQLAQGEAKASAQAVQGFADAFEKSRSQLLDAIAQAQESDAAPADLFRVERLGRVVAQLASELERVASGAGDALTARQRELVQLAGTHSQQLARAALGKVPDGFNGPTWRHVPIQGLQNLIGILGDGSPVQRILGEIAGESADRVRAAIVAGLGTGQTPGEIVRGIRTEIGGSMARTLTVIRTEDMRAYREAQRAAFEENSDVVNGWRWWSSLSFDTCAACLSNHGREFPLGEPMDSHPNCRCIAIPITKTWADLGHPQIADQKLDVQTGDEWLRSQPEDIQRRALGPSKFEAWKGGEIELRDLAAHRTNAIWGGMHVERSLQDAKIAAAKRIELAAKAVAPKEAAPDLSPDPISKRLFGGRTSVTIDNKADVDAFTKKHFGRKFTKKDWSRLAGAPTGTQLTVTHRNGSVLIHAQRNSYVDILKREIKVDGNGQPFLYNSHFEAARHPDPDNPGRFKSRVPNFGTRLLAQQVEAARQLGITRIHTFAAGDVSNGHFNGYYTWPRLGYSAPIPPHTLRSLHTEHPEWKDVADLHDLMLKKDGPAWWKQRGSSIEVDFDLRDGSRSMQRHQAYLENIGVRPVGLK